jgi:hypothetical protein
LGKRDKASGCVFFQAGPLDCLRDLVGAGKPQQKLRLPPVRKHDPSLFCLERYLQHPKHMIGAIDGIGVCSLY